MTDRFSIKCPECSGQALIRTSRVVMDQLREAYCICRNPECGEKFRVILEVSGKAAKESVNNRSYIGKWIGVELDGTLAVEESYSNSSIGTPNLAMLEEVKKWVNAGREVRIFTARACDPAQVRQVKAWLREHGLGDLEVTNIRDFGMAELWDNKAIAFKRRQQRYNVNNVFHK
jgi:hypothetical protein